MTDMVLMASLKRNLILIGNGAKKLHHKDTINLGWVLVTRITVG
ncbi:MAG: hypothetical protein R2879_17960 [Saprospiraceae bacterium]